MSGRTSGKAGVKGQLLLALMLCALFVRGWIPAGWMPTRSTDGYAISLCTGMGAVTAWVDGAGTIHKDKPVKSGTDDQPCAFAGVFNIAALPDSSGTLTAFIPTVIDQAAMRLLTSAIGQGLAAPPPPQTGPPANL